MATSTTVEICDQSGNMAPAGFQCDLTLMRQDGKFVTRIEPKSPSVALNFATEHDTFSFGVAAFKKEYWTAQAMVPIDRPAKLPLMLMPRKVTPVVDAAVVDDRLARMVTNVEGSVSDFVEREPRSAMALLNFLTVLDYLWVERLERKEDIRPYLRRLPLMPGSREKRTGIQPDRMFVEVTEPFEGVIKRDAETRKEQAVFRADPKLASAIFHPGATSGYREQSFDTANLQLSFHPKESGRGPLAEIDIDYFADKARHLFGEVIPNKTAKGTTDPVRVFQFRWMEHARRDKKFEPGYSLIAG